MTQQGETCKDWWTRNSARISGVSNVATAVAAILVAGTLIISLFHLDLARDQLKNAAVSLRGSTAFLVSQQGREIGKLLRQDLKGNAAFGFSFFHTAWYQKKIGALDEDLWKPIEAEICGFLGVVDAARFFSGSREKMFNSEFVDYIRNRSEECGTTR